MAQQQKMLYDKKREEVEKKTLEAHTEAEKERKKIIEAINAFFLGKDMKLPTKHSNISRYTQLALNPSSITAVYNFVNSLDRSFFKEEQQKEIESFLSRLSHLRDIITRFELQFSHYFIIKERGKLDHEDREKDAKALFKAFEQLWKDIDKFVENNYKGLNKSEKEDLKASLLYRIMCSYYGETAYWIATAYVKGDVRIRDLEIKEPIRMMKNEEERFKLVSKFLKTYHEKENVEIRNKFLTALSRIGDRELIESFHNLSYQAQVAIAKKIASFSGKGEKDIKLDDFLGLLNAEGEGSKAKTLIKQISTFDPRVQTAAIAYLFDPLRKFNTKDMEAITPVIRSLSQQLVEANAVHLSIGFLYEVGKRLDELFTNIRDIKWENIAKVGKEGETMKIEIESATKDSFTINIPNLNININVPKTVYENAVGLNEYIKPENVKEAKPKTFDELLHQITAENGRNVYHKAMVIYSTTY